MSSERKAISKLLYQGEGKDQGCGGVRCGGGGVGWLWDLTPFTWTKGYTSKIMHTKSNNKL